MTKKGEITKSADFTEHFAVGTTMCITPDGLVVIDFLKPDLKILVEDNANVKGYEGGLVTTTRVFMPVQSAKKFGEVLTGLIKSQATVAKKSGDKK